MAVFLIKPMATISLSSSVVRACQSRSERGSAARDSGLVSWISENMNRDVRAPQNFVHSRMPSRPATAMTMPIKRRTTPEDPTRFGRRLKFVDVIVRNEAVPWPCLEFANIQELHDVLQVQDADYLSCPHRQHRLVIEMLHHLHADGRQNDPVVYLFGTKTPGGNRLVFRPTVTYNYRDYINTAVELMHREPVFVEALNMTSGILATLLSEDVATQMLPGPGEHAPAA